MAKKSGVAMALMSLVLGAGLGAAVGGCGEDDGSVDIEGGGTTGTTGTVGTTTTPGATGTTTTETDTGTTTTETDTETTDDSGGYQAPGY